MEKTRQSAVEGSELACKPLELIQNPSKTNMKPRSSKPRRLVHSWDRIKHVHFYSLLGLSTHESVKWYPAMAKTETFTTTSTSLPLNPKP